MSCFKTQFIDKKTGIPSATEKNLDPVV
jgi:hypothetical protein